MEEEETSSFIFFGNLKKEISLDLNYSVVIILVKSNV